MPVTNVKSNWVAGNLVFYDKSGNIIATWDGTNRKLTIASGAAIDASAATGSISLAAGEIATADIANDAVTNDKLANITQGSIKVGGASNAPTDLDAKTSGQILVGDGTDVVSVAVSGDATLASTGALTIASEAVTPAKTSGIAVLYSLGTPELAVDNHVCESQNMVNDTYTLAASPQPDVPRIVTVTRTVVGDPDTPGILTITGTNSDDEVITEEITVGGHGVTVEGTKAFKTITSVVGSGWTIATDNDTIVVGTGDALGLPVTVDDAANVMLGILGTDILATNASVGTPATLEESTVDMSAGTYDGSAEALVFVKN